METMMIPETATQCWLKGNMKQFGRNTHDLAELSSVSESTVRRWLAGENVPNVMILCRIAIRYGWEIPEAVYQESVDRNNKRSTRHDYAAHDDGKTLCDECANAVPDKTGRRGCDWSRHFLPVAGWTAEPSSKYKDGWVVKDCPDYVFG